MPDLFPDTPPHVSIDDQIKCIERELGFRRHVYPRRIAAQQMTQALADREIGKMEAVLATLQKVKSAAGKEVDAEIHAQREALITQAHNRLREHLAPEVAKGCDGARSARLARWGIDQIVEWARIGIRKDVR